VSDGFDILYLVSFPLCMSVIISNKISFASTLITLFRSTADTFGPPSVLLYANLTGLWLCYVQLTLQCAILVQRSTKVGLVEA
jgi:hypothetical protein